MKNKLIRLLLILIPIFFFQCENGDMEISKFDTTEPIFSDAAKSWGELFAKNLNFVTKEVIEHGIDFEDKEQLDLSSQYFSHEFLLNNSLKSTQKTFIKENENFSVKDILERKIGALSEKQNEILELIATAASESKSYTEFSNRLVKINNEIYLSIPKEQQERLFFVTSTLYYGLKELNNLAKEGVIPGSPELGELKSAFEEESWWCDVDNDSKLATVWLIALAEPTPVGEVIATGATIIIAGILLYEFIGKCRDIVEDINLDVDNCIQLFYKCVDETNTPDYICTDCLHFCGSGGEWDSNACPLLKKSTNERNRIKF